MNVFNIRKQCDVKLRYTTHAIQRAEERNIPIPTYVPFNAVCDGKDIRDGDIVFRIVYKYQGSKYCMVVMEDMLVLTMFGISSQTFVEQMESVSKNKYSIKQHQKALRSSKTDEYYMLKEGKYRNMEFEIGYNSYSYA